MKSFAPSLNRNEGILNDCMNSNCMAIENPDQFHSACHVADVECEQCLRVKLFRDDWNCSDLRQIKPDFLVPSNPKAQSCLDVTSSEVMEKKANETVAKKDAYCLQDLEVMSSALEKRAIQSRASFDNLINEFGSCRQHSLRQQRSLMISESDSSKSLFCVQNSLRFQPSLLNGESHSSKSLSQQRSNNTHILSSGVHLSFGSSSNTCDNDYLTIPLMPKPDASKIVPQVFEESKSNSMLPAPKEEVVDSYLYSNGHASSVSKTLAKNNALNFQTSLDVPSFIGTGNCDDTLLGNLDTTFNSMTSRHKDVTTEEENSVSHEDDERTDSSDSLQDLHFTKKSVDMNRFSTPPRASIAADTKFSLAYEEEIPSYDKIHIFEDFNLDTVTQHTAPKGCIQLIRGEDESMDSLDLNDMSSGLCDPAYPNKLFLKTSNPRFVRCSNRIQNKQYQDNPRGKNFRSVIRLPIGHEDDINFIGNFMWSRGIKDDGDIQIDCNPNGMDPSMDGVCKQAHTHTCKTIASDVADCIGPGCSVLGIAIDAAIDLLPPEYAEPTEYATSLNGEGLYRPQDRGWLENAVSSIVARRKNLSKNDHHLFQPPNLCARNGAATNLIRTDFPINLHDEDTLGLTAANDKSAKIMDHLINGSEQDLTDEEFYFVYFCTKKEFYEFPCWIRIQKRAEGKDRRLLLLQTETMSKKRDSKEEHLIDEDVKETPIGSFSTL